MQKGVLILLLLASACAHRAADLSAPLSALQTQQAREALQTRPPGPPLWAANGTLAAFGHNERIRLRVQWLVASPNQFRLTALGPHNAAIAVVASDGATLSSLDLQSGELQRHPATREGLLRLTHGIDVGLPLPMWLSLLSFTMAVPQDAVAYPRAHGQVAWTFSMAADSPQVTVLADAKGRIVAAHVPDASGNTVEASFLPATAANAPMVVKDVFVRIKTAQPPNESTLQMSLEAADTAPPVLPGSSPFVVGAAP